jgi:DNA-binding CsgD family transcriptional regulator
VDDFVGRKAELRVLMSSLDLMRSGRGGLVLLAGESGIGKTRLAEELSGRARSCGSKTVWGRCVELEGAPPYWPWIQVLRSLAKSEAETRVRREGETPELSFVLPEFKPAGSRHRHDRGDRFRLFDAVTDRLRAASNSGGLVVVLDDLQWAERPSLAMLQHVSRHLHDAPLLVIATYRNEPAEDKPLWALLPELLREHGALHLKLAGLDREDVGRYLLAACAKDVDDGLAATIHDWTGGNPFLVRELASMLANERGLQPVASQQSVGDVIGRRLRSLSTSCHTALAAASVLGREYNLTLLSKVTDQPAEGLLRVMDEAVRAGLVAEATPGGDCHRFVHDLIRETLYRSMPASERIRMHRRAAQEIETGGAADLAALAHHWIHAVPLGGWEKAVFCSVEAARQAEDQLAYEEAVRLYTQALLALPGSAGQGERRCSVLIDLARAQYRSGDVGLSLDSSVEAAAMAASLGRADLQAQAALVLEGVSDRELGPALRRLCQDALAAAAPTDEALRARLLGQYVELLEDVPNTEERRETLSCEALQLAERVEDEKALAAALHGRHAATTGPDYVEERLGVGTRLVELAGRSAWPAQAVWSRLWRIDSFFQLGQLGAIPAELIELEDLVQRLHQHFFRWHLLRSRAALAHVTGRFNEALNLTEAAFGVGRAEQHRTTEIVYRAARGWLAFDRGDNAPMDEYLSMAARGPRYDLPIINASAVIQEIALGRAAAAKDRFDRLIASYPSWEKDGRWLLISTYLARAAVVLGSNDHVRMLYEALLPYGRLFAASGAGAAVCRGAVAQQLGELAAALGLAEEADRLLCDAIARNRSAGATPFVAYSQFSHAKALARGGATVRAKAEARAALVTAARLGMRPLREQSAELLAELDRGAPKLSSRETEVAQILADGLSNREIASELHLSERTAESHVKHIMDKLGFKSRSQIAAWATGQGLVGERGLGRSPESAGRS